MDGIVLCAYERLAWKYPEHRGYIRFSLLSQITLHTPVYFVLCARTLCTYSGYLLWTEADLVRTLWSLSWTNTQRTHSGE